MKIGELLSLNKNYIYNVIIFKLLRNNNLIGDWGLGIGVWGLGIGPNPQSPIPNPQSPIKLLTGKFFIIK